MIHIEKLRKESIERIVILEELYLGETLGEELLTSELDNPTLCFLGAYDNDQVVGYLGGYFIQGEAEILNFVIDEYYQRKGIGTMLLNTAISMYPDLTKITLEVRSTNQKGINFYLKNNFNQVSIRKHYYKNGDDALVMLKVIKNENISN